MKRILLLLLLFTLQACTISNDVKTHMICTGLVEYSERTELGLPKIPTTRNYTLIERRIQNFLVSGKGIYHEETDWLLIEDDKLISEPKEWKLQGESELRKITVSEHKIHLTEFITRPERDIGNQHLASLNAVNDIHFERISGDSYRKKHSWGTNSKTKENTNEKSDSFGKCDRVEKKF